MESGESAIGAVPSPSVPHPPPRWTTESPAASEFAAWVGPHVQILAALAVREVGESAAADVVQETLLRAWRRRETYRAERGTAISWLIGILRDQGRRHRTRRPNVRHEPMPDPTETGSGAEDRLDLEAAIAALPDRQRQVITLYYVADASVADIASVLGISTGTVKSTLHDARAALRRRLESE